MLSWIILPFVTGVRINGFVAGARNFMGFRNNDERIVCYRTNGGGGGIEGEVEERDSSRLVKSSPPHCLQYLLEACVYIYIYTPSSSSSSSCSVRVARESSISIATRTSSSPPTRRLVTRQLPTRFSPLPSRAIPFLANRAFKAR